MSWNDPDRDDAAEALRERLRRARSGSSASSREVRGTTPRHGGGEGSRDVGPTSRQWLLLFGFALFVVIVVGAA